MALPRLRPGIVVDAECCWWPFVNEVLQAGIRVDVAYSRDPGHLHLLFRYRVRSSRPVPAAGRAAGDYRYLCRASPWSAWGCNSRGLLQHPGSRLTILCRTGGVMAGFLAFGAGFRRGVDWAAWSRILVWLGVASRAPGTGTGSSAGQGYARRGPGDLLRLQAAGRVNGPADTCRFRHSRAGLAARPGVTPRCGPLHGHLGVIIVQHRSAWVSLMIAVVLCGIHLFRQQPDGRGGETVIGVAGPSGYWRSSCRACQGGLRPAGVPGFGFRERRPADDRYVYRDVRVEARDVELTHRRLRSISTTFSLAARVGVTPALGPGAQVMNPFNTHTTWFWTSSSCWASSACWPSGRSFP